MTTRTDRLLRKLEDIRRTDGITLRHLEEMLAPSVTPESAAPPGPVVTPEALDSWRKFERKEPLDQSDMFRLESIVLSNGLRPAFDIQNDTYAPLPSVWQDLNDHRSAVNSMIRGIGRVNLTGHPQLTFVGTAFACGDKRLMTNRHVAELFTRQVGNGLIFTPGITASTDLKQEVGSSDSVAVNIVATETILDTLDVAILRVDSFPANVPVLPLVGTPPASIENRMATIIGYPAFDPAEDLLQQMQIFRSVFDKKRLQPGRLKGIKPVSSFGRTVQALTHDCSTLGGNSGSVLIDVDSERVVGVHFGGTPLVANFAAPAWEIARDPKAAASGLEFV